MPLNTLLGRSARILNLYPGGNQTYLVLDPDAQPEKYPEINRGILAQNQNWSTNFEQGGFIRRASSPEAVARLEMAGGEFCGNATRAFGATLLKDFLGPKGMRSMARFENIAQDDGSYRFAVEVSGAPKPLQVLARQVGNSYEVQTEVPVRSDPNSVSQLEISLNGTTVPVSLVRLDGIAHFVVDEKALPFEPIAAVYEEQLKLAIAQCGLLNEPAVGMIWRKDTGECLQINPVVWVKSIDTCFFESACGSGSVAAGMLEALRSNDSSKFVRIKQPSGSMIDVTVERDVITGEYTRALISGLVEIRGEISWRGKKKQVEEPESALAALIAPRTLRGFRDRMPAEALQKNEMLAKLRGVFERFGFSPIETPHLEYTECLLGGASNEIKKQLYRFTDNGDRDVLLRFDLTVPFARFISEHKNELGIPFKRWAIGNVFRGENPQAGRYREFTQCDFDFVGTKSLSADAETVQVMGACMQALGVADYTIRINNRRLMNGLGEALGIGARVADVLQAVDKLEKVGADEVRAELTREVGLNEAQTNGVLNFIEISRLYRAPELFERARAFPIMNDAMRSGIEELEELFGILEQSGFPMHTCKVDLSIARGLGYYTGIVYETSLNGAAGVGSVCSGGRYDNLTQTFSREPLPGVGASVGIDRLMAGLEQLGRTGTRQTAAVALVAATENGALGRAHHLAGQLRALGHNIEVYPEGGKLGKPAKYAERRGHRYLLGIDTTRESLSVEELSSGTRREFPISSDTIREISDHINGESHE